MQTEEAWARAMLGRLGQLPQPQRHALVTGPLERMRLGVMALMSVLPTYSNQAIASAQILGNVLMTVQSINERVWDTDSGLRLSTMRLDILHVEVPAYPAEIYEPMVTRILRRGPRAMKRKLKQMILAWLESMDFLFFRDTHGSDGHLMAILAALSDAIAIIKALLLSQQNFCAP